MSASTPVARPASVTIVVVLTWLSALGSIVSGILALLLSDSVLAEADVEKSTATAYGWIGIVLGVVIALVAIGLGRGNTLARVLVSGLMVLRIVIGIWAMFVLPDSIVSGAIVAGIALIVLILLWNQKANNFFLAD
jgi:hypothetical protein